MIGVLAGASDEAIVAELFELFKTPWEFYRSGHSYDAVLCTDTDTLASCSAKAVLVYGGDLLPLDAEHQVRCHSRKSQAVLLHGSARIPVYGRCATFEDQSCSSLIDEGSQMPAIWRREEEGQVLIRVGYDLLDEVRRLLTEGQPAIFADSPTLDWHITVLRKLILGAGIALTEIPPLPAGYPFIACLTHDVDHPSLRLHRWDHTILGFLWRATAGSLLRFLRRRMAARDVLANWKAACKLFFVQKGLTRDFWRDFAERYAEIEKGLCSTFFIIPFKDHAGVGTEGEAPEFRAAAYGIADIADVAAKITASGSEVALHGLDAWTDADRGRAELEEICRVTGEANIGVRMHWLYFDPQSPSRLEEAGAIYDSTAGYRETAGYKSGTTQVYRPPCAQRLLELPMHAMDTALFSPVCLGLSSEQVTERMQRMTGRAMELGGCLTVNWHDRSLAPERLWYRSYRETVESLKERGAWFATARQAVAWFQKRRAVVFEGGYGSQETDVRITGAHASDLPALRLRIYEAQRQDKAVSDRGAAYVERCFDQTSPAEIHALRSNDAL
jgi:hypothetical protein